MNNTKSTLVCYACEKAIRGTVLRTSPPRYLINLGLDFPRAYHPRCYARAEKLAAKELGAKP